MGVKVDCDSHFLPHDAFDDIEQKFSGLIPKFVFDGSGKQAVVYKARTEKLPAFMWNYPTCFRLLKQAPGVSNADARVEDLAKIGFDRQVLVPNNGPYAFDVEPDLGASVCRSFNSAVGKVLTEVP